MKNKKYLKDLGLDHVNTEHRRLLRAYNAQFRLDREKQDALMEAWQTYMRSEKRIHSIFCIDDTCGRGVKRSL